MIDQLSNCNVCPCPLHSVLYFVSDISIANKMSITLHSLFYQLYQQTSALQLRLSKFNSLSLSTPFHFRFHNLIKWPFCSLLCYRYINSKQNGYHSSLIILFKMKTLFPIKFANTILSQLGKPSFEKIKKIMESEMKRSGQGQTIKFTES